MRHTLWCFVEGFGMLSAGVLGIVLIAFAFSKLVRFLKRRFEVDVEVVLLGVVFIIVGVTISLGLCAQ